MSNNKCITPNQILAARDYAKAAFPDIPEGYGAVIIDFTKGRKDPKGLCTYYPIRILCNNGTKWEPVEPRIKFKNLTTIFSAAPNLKKGYYTSSMNFSIDATYMDKVDGKEVVQRYGEAKVFLHGAIEHHAGVAVMKRIIIARNTTIVAGIHRTRLSTEKGTQEAVANPYCTISIPFKRAADGNTVSPITPPGCVIFDGTKKAETAEEKRISLFKRAYVEANGEKQAINFGNIGSFITKGSLITGIETISDVTVSGQGISAPSKCKGFIIVWPGNGGDMMPNDAFSEEEMAEMIPAPAEESKGKGKEPEQPDDMFGTGDLESRLKNISTGMGPDEV